MTITEFYKLFSKFEYFENTILCFKLLSNSNKFQYFIHQNLTLNLQILLFLHKITLFMLKIQYKYSKLKYQMPQKFK